MPDRDSSGRPARGRLKPSSWARVDRVQLIRREVREVLAPSALEVLLGHAERQIEGGAELGDHSPAAGRVYATLMVTIDLQHCARFFREPADTATAERVAELMADSPALDRKLTRMVGAELAKLAGCALEDLDVTVDRTIRAEKTTLYVDGDAMGVVRTDGRGKRLAQG